MPQTATASSIGAPAIAANAPHKATVVDKGTAKAIDLAQCMFLPQGRTLTHTRCSHSGTASFHLCSLPAIHTTRPAIQERYNRDSAAIMPSNTGGASSRYTANRSPVPAETAQGHPLQEQPNSRPTVTRLCLATPMFSNRRSKRSQCSSSRRRCPGFSALRVRCRERT
jgi:hypothetical protein